MTCTHHWRLDTPEGLVTHGRCQHCGAERTWKQEHRDWNDGGTGDGAREVNRIQRKERLSLPPWPIGKLTEGWWDR